MKENYLYKYYIINLLVIFTSIALFTISCSKSADDLYYEGKFLSTKEETLDKGLKLLIQFEKKFPRDIRIPEVVLSIGSLYKHQKNFDEAVSAFERLIENYPDSREAYNGKFLLGYMYYDDLNDNEKAGRVLNDFIKTYPDSELTVSAKVLMENIGLPIEEWSVIKKLELDEPSEDDSQVFR